MIALSTLAVVAGLGSLVAVVVLWVRNYRSTGDAPEATSRTTQSVVGLVSATLLSVVVGISEFGALLGTAGDIVSTWPGGIGQAALGLLAIAGFSGWLEIGVVGATITVLAVIAITTAIRN